MTVRFSLIELLFIIARIITVGLDALAAIYPSDFLDNQEAKLIFFLNGAFGTGFIFVAIAYRYSGNNYRVKSVTLGLIFMYFCLRAMSVLALQHTYHSLVPNKVIYVDILDIGSSVLGLMYIFEKEKPTLEVTNIPN
jgi:hypothetical protein